MNNELYREVLSLVKSKGYSLAEYGESGDVPHHIWDGWKYLSDEVGEKICSRGLRDKSVCNDIVEQLHGVGVYDSRPYLIRYNDIACIFIGAGRFLSYNSEYGCFVLAKYPDGYDEIERNCLGWGKLFDTDSLIDDSMQVVLSMVVWYNYCELCHNSPHAKVAITECLENDYNTIADFVKEVIDFDMISYCEMKGRNFMTVDMLNTRQHITVRRDRVYNIGEDDDCTVEARFSFNDSELELEYKSSETNLSNRHILSVPVISSASLQWFKTYRKIDITDIVKYCLPGFMARYGIYISWTDACSWISSNPMYKINVRSVNVQTFEDVFNDMQK